MVTVICHNLFLTLIHIIKCVIFKQDFKPWQFRHVYSLLPSELDIDNILYLQHPMINHCCFFLSLSFCSLDCQEINHTTQMTAFNSLLSSIYQFQQVHPLLPSKLDVDNSVYLWHPMIDYCCFFLPFSSSLGCQELNHTAHMTAYYSLMPSVQQLFLIVWFFCFVSAWFSQISIVYYRVHVRRYWSNTNFL